MGLAGVAGLVGAAGFTVAAATAFGVAAGISPAVVGLLAVAVGTSLPEMMVNFKAARKGETDMAIGNVVGSNVFNLVLIGGLLSLTGAPMPPDLNAKATTQGLVNTLAFGMSALFTTLAMAKNKDGLNKKHGIVGLALYAAYTAATFVLGKGAATPPTPPPPPGP
jgi:cation:H+ antiporter